MAMGFHESEVIALLQKVFATTDSSIRVGIGDDAAVVMTSPESVLTSDMAVQDVHFKLEWSSAFDIGRKITAANIADVLSMGARCQYLTAAVTLTGDESLQWIENLAQGMKHEAGLAGAHIVGGDIARGMHIVISMSAIGHTAKPILRKGATVGDDIFISSLTGWSAAGLALLSGEISISSRAADKALSEFSAPTLDYESDYSGATSMADVSDCILIQAGQIAIASGVAMKFDPELCKSSQEFSELSALAEEVKVDVFEWIFAGGEDHVLLATGRNLPGVKIGSVSSGSGVLGIDKKMAPVSWSHF
ncbi:MAG: AIR synthase related protein [Candidatus Planktophila sp.]|jgi:thiamine-monophosphate kinase|tara:strand:- start:1485 stop:2402 length:918 start_codon:yes stop_codon:yes gene_type:complete